MASSGEVEDWNWPKSGQEGPDVEWEHVPIPPVSPPSPITSNIFIPPISSKETDDNKGEEKKEQKLPSVEGIQLEGEDEKGALPKVRTFEKYNPSPEELKALPDNLDEIFDKHGDDIILEDDENGRNQHIYYFFGQHEGKKHYKCIKKDCPSSLLVEEIMEPSPPPSPSPPPTPKEDEQDKEHSKKKKRKSKKKSKKTAKEGNPQEEELQENEDWNK